MRIVSIAVSKTKDNNLAVYSEVVSGTKTYSQRIEISEKEVISWSCNCGFGNIGRFRKEFILTDKKCRHINKLYMILKDMEYLK